MPLLITKSKQLAYLLRHDKNYDFEPGGWRLLSDLCQLHSLSLEEIIDIVSRDDKGRFEFNSGQTKVRALYGHSVEVDLLLHRQEPPPLLLHGTALKYIDSIRSNGLKSKARRYVHLTEDRDLALKIGSRHGQVALLLVDSQSMFDDGYDFYHTDNGMWLIPEVPAKYVIFN